MNKFKTSKFASGIFGGLLALAMVVGVAAPTAQAAALTSAQVSAIVSLLQSFGADAGTIANVQASLTGQPVMSSGTTGTTMMSGYQFNTNLSVGMTSPDVLQLQKILNSNPATQVATTGAGSPGMESTYFGALTKAAVIAFQNLHGIVPASGFVGSLTRGALNSMTAMTTTTSSPTTTTTTTTTTTAPAAAGTLTVSSAAQPMNSLAPQGASRVPFTTFTLTAGASDVMVSGVTIQRVGLGSDNVFSGVVLLDANGNQIGNSQTFNSNHQATIGTTMTVPAGTSQTFTVAGNMQTSLANYAGQVIAIEVTGVNTSATVQGSVLTAPIVGAQQTINATVSLGTAQIAVSSYDPNSSTSQNVGTTGYRFSGVKITAGSQENITLKSIRWNQVGSAGSSDLANIVTYVNGTAYPATLDSTGKYYTSNFGAGIQILEGNSVDAYIQADIVGADAAGRNVEFDLYKNTDINIVGDTYGYGIIPMPSGNTNTAWSSSGGSLFLTSDGNSITTSSTNYSLTPFFHASVVTVTAGTASTISNSNTVPAQNIGVNVSNVPLGAFTATILGEPIDVQTMVFHLATTTGSLGSAVTSVKLVNSNGQVIAGPYDAVPSTNGTTQTVTFSSKVTIPVGTNTYTLEGTIPTTAKNGTILYFSTNPSGGDWQNVTGDTTGDNISLSAGNFTMSQMTIQGNSLTITTSSNIPTQSIVAGNTQILGEFLFDTTQSGAAINLSSLPLNLGSSLNSGSSGLTSCQIGPLTNGNTITPLNSRTTVNPTVTGAVNNSSTANVTFQFDNSYTFPQGTVTTLAVQCYVPSTISANTKYQWGIDGTSGTNGTVSATSPTSSGAVTVSIPASNAGSTITVTGQGTFAVTLDPSSPVYTVAYGGITGTSLAALQFNSQNEPINITQVSLKLGSGSAADLQNGQVWLYSGNTQLGTATFNSAGYATSTKFTTNAFTVTPGTPAVLTIKGNINPIGLNQPGVIGDTVKVAYNAADTLGTYGVGVSSSATIYHTNDSTVTAAGVNIQKSYPTINCATCSSATTITSGQTANLISLSIGASPNGQVQMNQLTFNISTSTATVGSLNFIGPRGSVGTVGVSANGKIATVTFNSSSNTADALIAANSSNTYTLQGQVTFSGGTSGTSGSVSTVLDADTAAAVNGATSTLTTPLIIWSPDSTTTQPAGYGNDWTNGYGLPGCFTTYGLGQNCAASTVVSN